MSGSPTRLSCCDRDCAAVNGCTIGGYQCDRCGKFFCPDCDTADDQGRCPSCHEEAIAELEAEIGICARCAKYGTDDCVDPFKGDEDTGIITEICTGFEKVEG